MRGYERRRLLRERQNAAKGELEKQAAYEQMAEKYERTNGKIAQVRGRTGLNGLLRPIEGACISHVAAKRSVVAGPDGSAALVRY